MMIDRAVSAETKPWPYFFCVTLLFLPLLSAIGGDEDKGPLDRLSWRNVGPINPSGRVADVEGIPGDPRVLYVGSASGGIWKTTNGGITFESIFDVNETASIGDLGLAPSNPGVIYAGTGEGNVRNSVSFGNGVYKSTDGGAHWEHMGLEETRHISRVVVHPTDPNTVWVAAIGHIYGPNEERGVFKSTDGGASWQKVLYIDDRHGAADIDVDPSNPNILYAAMWYFQRNPWDHDSGSEEGGVYKSIDGGKTWKKITKGLPKTMGRIGVKVAPSSPNVVYVIAESNDGIMFRSEDHGESFQKTSDNVQIVSRGFYYTDLRVDPTDENRVFAIASRLFRSIDGGRNFQRISRSTHVDYHSIWIDPLDPSRVWQGQDGGVAVSYDGGDSWEPIRNLPLAQLYQAYFDNRKPFYYTGGGLQDNGAWYGPSRTREPAGILSDDWRIVSFGDAYFVVPHPEEPEIMISESQAGGIVKTDMRTRVQKDISPQPRRNDGGPAGDLTYRFNWNAPIIASPYDPMTVYFAGNVVFKSTDFGESWEKISPDLTTNDPEKMGDAGGPVWKENTTAEYHCTIISFAESPVEQGLLWVGTDDGNLQISRNGGDSWDNITSSVPGVPAYSPVSHVEPSAVKAGRAYVAFDRHMFDDFRPHVFRTENYGRSWKNISGNLPEIAYVWSLREDPRNPDMIYAGTEIGLFVSYTGGNEWERFHLANLPTVAVHDVLVHPRENDIILGTHGRGIFIFDDATPLQQFKKVEKAGKAHLFPPRAGVHHAVKFTRYGMGDKKHTSPNPPYGIEISYYLPEALEEPGKERQRGRRGQGARRGQRGGPPRGERPEKKKERLVLEVLDSGGKVIRKLSGFPKQAGLNRTSWSMDTNGPRPRSGAETGNEWFGPPRGPFVPMGTYTIRMTLDDKSMDQQVEVTLDPGIEFSGEAAKTRFDAATIIVGFRSRTNDMLRALDLMSEQLGERKKTMRALKAEMNEQGKEVMKAFEKAHEEMLDTLTRPEGKPFWSEGPRLSGSLFSLYFGINGAFSAPSAAQMELIETLRGEVDNAEKRYQALAGDTLVALNKAFSEAGVPPIVLPEDISKR